MRVLFGRMQDGGVRMRSRSGVCLQLHAGGSVLVRGTLLVPLRSERHLHSRLVRVRHSLGHHADDLGDGLGCAEAVVFEGQAEEDGCQEDDEEEDQDLQVSG